MIAWIFSEIITVSLVGFGWLIAVVCILRKFDRTTGRYSCLAGDLVTATFSAITVVAVVSISFAMYTDLSDAHEANRTLHTELSETKIRLSELRADIDSLHQDRGSLSERNRTLIVEIENLRNLVQAPTTIFQELILLWEDGKIGDQILARASISKHFGSQVNVTKLEFDFELSASRTIKCYLEGSYSNGVWCDAH